MKNARRNLLVGGEVINIDPEIDFQRVAGSKSKKTKQMYQHMMGALSVDTTVCQYTQGLNMLGKQLDSQAWKRG
jgi:predicted RNase H-like nuclease